MIGYILCSSIVLALATLYIGYKKGSYSLFDKLCSIYLLFVICHTLYSFVFLEIFPLPEIQLTGVPFIFGYGPFFFMGLQSLTQDKIEKKYIYLNFAPLIVFSLLYMLLLSDTTIGTGYFLSFYIIECTFVVVSLFGYAFWAMFMLRPSQSDQANGNLKMQLIKTAAFTLILMALLFAVVAILGLVVGQNIDKGITGAILYAGILVSLVLAFIYSINNLTVKKEITVVKANELYQDETVTVIQKKISDIERVNVPIEEAVEKKQSDDIPVLQKYNKSALSPAVLSDYKEKLNRLIDIDKVYLDNELTLELLAKKMKMPMHHLTQLFNVYLGENFNQYINKYRIEYAKEVLEENDRALSIEQIAFSSGFNSKVSFNRHFKILTGATPKEYVSNYRQ